MPLGPEYDKMIDSRFADKMKNTSGRQAGSITAAQFLKRFVGDTPGRIWTLPAPRWARPATTSTPPGALGFGVRLLDELVRQMCER